MSVVMNFEVVTKKISALGKIPSIAPQILLIDTTD